jgi:hypothetical protein
MPMHKLTLEMGGTEVDQASPATFQRQVTISGKERLLISVPPDQPSLFLHLAEILPPPYFVLYVLHTPRGEGEPGRYQSTELSWEELRSFLIQYQSYFAGDARHDVWVYSPTSGRTLIWDRHNQIFAEGHPLDDIMETLVGIGFKEDAIGPISDHYHHYRPEFDEEASSVLHAFDWRRTPLRPEDEQ